jgi:hypothetical protein
MLLKGENMNNLYSFTGAGWYVSESNGDGTDTFRLNTRARHEDNYLASQDARIAGAGTPRWYDTEEQLRAALGR